MCGVLHSCEMRDETLVWYTVSALRTTTLIIKLKNYCHIYVLLIFF
jgi:hypothetical protein